MKYAVLYMDIEDWYHLDYFRGSKVDRKFTMLDGLHEYLKILDDYELKTTFFSLGEIANSLKSDLREISQQGHEIAAHGWRHQRPLTMSNDKFDKDITHTKDILEQIVGQEILGYRAPCFSLNRELLGKVEDAGFLYDSSKIDFSNHPLYGGIDTSDFKFVDKNIYSKNDFYEFEVSTLPVLGKPIPISGGGYLRIFPWLVMKKLISSFCKSHNFFVLYIHPFELSTKSDPALPSNISWSTKKRFSIGRQDVKTKLNHLIKLLKTFDFEFVTFSKLRENLINN